MYLTVRCRTELSRKGRLVVAKRLGGREAEGTNSRNISSNEELNIVTRI